MNSPPKKRKKLKKDSANITCTIEEAKGSAINEKEGFSQQMLLGRINYPKKACETSLIVSVNVHNKPYHHLVMSS